MICPNTLAASITAVAIALADGRSDDEINVLGAAFTQLGDTLTLMGVQRDRISQSGAEKEK